VYTETTFIVVRTIPDRTILESGPSCRVFLVLGLNFGLHSVLNASLYTPYRGFVWLYVRLLGVLQKHCGTTRRVFPRLLVYQILHVPPQTTTEVVMLFIVNLQYISVETTIL
jgi:hypothetical protein